RMMSAFHRCEYTYYPENTLEAVISAMKLGADFIEIDVRVTKDGVPILMHPEASPEVTCLADELLSTGGILRFVRESAEKEFIIATEIGILHRLQVENPDKKFIPLTEQAICPHMKLIRLEDLLRALETGETEITVPEELRQAAERPIRAMLQA
ncbi:MAG: quinolinate synthase NadA, partial [Lentisphaeria bacterium]|nr:quinolinate synthase NadA [Lentisphaeria bacterium]